jgi:predicted DsbA family dithiol-disulfide isomerase
VSLAFKLAFESPQITAEAIEAIEFPHLGQLYQVRGVPKTVINGTIHVEGAVPESQLMEAIKKAVGQPSSFE